MALPINAIAAYKNALQVGKAAPAGEAGGDFGTMLKSAAQESIDTVKKGEQMTAQGVVGKADLADVVTAVSNAEVTVQAVVAVRDRVISAYQEIMRMPI